jgi:hypothetical protein
VNWPTNQTYTDSQGNIWGYENSSWQVVGYVTGSSAYTAAQTAATAASTAATAPAGAPASPASGQQYTDASGNLWTYSGGQWVLTESASSASNWMASLSSFLQESTIISGVQNFWLVAGVGAAALLLMDFSGKKR